MTTIRMTELDDLLNRLCEDAAGIIGAEASSIFLRDGDTLTMKAAYGYSKAGVGEATYKIGEGITGWIAENNTFLANSDEDIKKHPSWLGKWNKKQWANTDQTCRGLIGVPLISKDFVIGVIKVENKKNCEFTQDDVNRLEIYARNATSFIETKKESLAIMNRIYVFVLIPFAAEFKDIYKYGIKQTIDGMGMKCERVDERHFTRSVLQEIYRCIEKSHIVVADITGRNPNVFYEIGYAHALKKDVILLVQNEDDVPFDLYDMNHINYGGSIDTLSLLLRKRIEGMISGEYSLGETA